MRLSATVASLLAASVLVGEIAGQETKTTPAPSSSLPVGTPDKINAYLGQLKTGSVEERTAAAYALGSFGVKAKAAVPILRQVLKEEDPWLRIAAAQSLWKINRDSTAVAAFTELVAYKADAPLPVLRGG